jgi:hypothetical protein
MQDEPGEHDNRNHVDHPLAQKTDDKPMAGKMLE